MISSDPPTLRRPAQPVLAGLAVVFCLTLLVLGMAYVGYFRIVDAGRARGIEETRDAFFTPGDQTTNGIVKRVNAATATVHVQAYSFTSAPIAKALVEAKRCGVDVIAVTYLGRSAGRSVTSGIRSTARRHRPEAHKLTHNDACLANEAVGMFRTDS